MRSPSAFRIGCVSYLNAKPLIAGLGDDLVLDHPAELAPALWSGHLDAALLPVRSILDHPGATVVDGAGIASEGPVCSVLLAHRGPLGTVCRVGLDPASLTSSQLVRVVLERFHSLRPLYAEGPAPGDLRAPEPGEGLLKIGDQALAFRRLHRDGGDVLCLDLGEAWTRTTELPFVFALWCLRPGLERPERLADALRQAMEQGTASIDAIVQDLPDPAFARDYLTHHIRHRVGDREKAGLLRFAEELAAMGVLPDDTSPGHWKWV